MKNVAIIKNMKGEVMETRKFRSYPEVERYIATKYDNNIYDWMIKKDLVETNKLDEIDLKFGLEVGYELAKVHTIVIKGE